MRGPLLVVLLSWCSACGAAVINGVDAGLINDAGVVSDAGAQVDAGVSDAGIVDAGVTVDAGIPDAGIPDAGIPDAGVLDAGTPDAGTPDAGQPATMTGVLLGGTGPWPGAISGVRYESGTLSGVTDGSGTFQYQAGQTITFLVGDVALGPLTPRAQLTAWQLAGNGCVPSTTLDGALVLLLSLDDDADPANGTHLPALPAVTPRVALSTLSLADLGTRIAAWIPGRTALTPAVAMDRFIRQVDDETWAELGMDTFNGTTALSRGQGVATDGTSWFFSGTLSLEKTDLSFNRQVSNGLAIPPALALTLGSNHIGDIDVFNGTLYAPIEDGSGYMNPRLVKFDASNLNAGMVFTIPQSLQTQGVPWVAVDGARGFLYFAEWNPTTQLNIFSLANVTYLRSLALTPPAGLTLGRIQGAKVFEGALYLNTDDTGKTVYKLNLETGTVLRLFSITGGGENEGLAVLLRPDGSALHTLNVTTSSSGVELRHHRRTRLPLRWGVCP